MRRVTIKDIAREAGVSPQTVSRAINNKGEISPQTRERILRIAKRLGYRPNSVARGLATRRTQNVGLVVPDVSNPFFSVIARGIEDTAHQANYNVFLCNTDENTVREINAIHSLEDQRVDGIILCSSRLSDRELSELTSRYQSLVLVNRQIDHPRTRCLLVDDVEGAKEATAYLLRLGHRNIGLLAGPQVSHSGQKRKRGYQQALREHYITPPADWQVYCPPQVAGGQVAARQLLGRAPDLTSIVAYNDLVAVGALRACVELGLRVPGDCAIVGCDDIPLAALVSPALTTVHIPKYELGQKAMHLLLEMIEADTEHPADRRGSADAPSSRDQASAQGVGQPPRVILAPHLIIRESTGSP